MRPERPGGVRFNTAVFVPDIDWPGGWRAAAHGPSRCCPRTSSSWRCPTSPPSSGCMPAAAPLWCHTPRQPMRSSFGAYLPTSAAGASQGSTPTDASLGGAAPGAPRRPTPHAAIMGYASHYARRQQRAHRACLPRRPRPPGPLCRQVIGGSIFGVSGDFGVPDFISTGAFARDACPLG